MALPLARVAVRRALADYLRTNLISTWPNVVVSENWPTPQTQLPEQAVTVLVPQGGFTVEYHQPVIWSVTTANGVSTITYSYGKMEMPLQIDAWAQFEAVRDDLAASVLPLLNQNVEVTLGTATLANLALAPGLVIPIPTYANVTAEFRFDSEPMLSETTSLTEASDWRATWSGSAFVYLMQQETQPVMREVIINLSAPPGSTPDVIDIVQ